MHLLLVHQNFPGQFRDLAPAWLAAGHRVSAIGQVSEPPAGDSWRGLHYSSYAIAADASCADLCRAQAVAATCRQLLSTEDAPDLVLVHSGWGEALLLRQAFPHTPILVYPELWGSPPAMGVGIDPDLPSADQRLWGLEQLLERQNLLSQLALSQADAAVVASQRQIESFPAALQPQLQLLPEGVDLERLRPDPQAQFNLPEQATFRPGDLLVTHVSRQLEPLRGLRQVMRAWPQVAQAVPDAQLLLVGGTRRGYGLEAPRGASHLADALAALPADVDASRIHHVERLGYSDLVALLQCSACHLALSYPYTLSWSWLEAMACGAPLVTNPESPLGAHVTHGQEALVVPFAETAPLVEAIVELLLQPELRQRIALGGRAMVAAEFNLKRARDGYSAVFQRFSQQSSSANKRGQSARQSPCTG